MTNSFEIVDGPDDANDADYVVCARLTRPLYFADNIIDLCCRCGEAIQHRPHIPTVPKKVCYQCINPEMEKDAAKGELTTIITQKTADEMADYFRKKDAN